LSFSEKEKKISNFHLNILSFSQIISVGLAIFLFAKTERLDLDQDKILYSCFAFLFSIVLPGFGRKKKIAKTFLTYENEYNESISIETEIQTEPAYLYIITEKIGNEVKN